MTLAKYQEEKNDEKRTFIRFLLEWSRAPLRTGAIAPSGPALARIMTHGLSEEDAPVIELGPGTGVFTNSLLANKLPEARVAVIEASGRFAALLSDRFPGVTVIHGDATRVRSLSPFHKGEVGAVICGLPLLSMPPRSVFRILAGSFAILRPGPEFRLFTYGGRCPVDPAILQRLGLNAKKAAFTPMNVPPASVYKLTR